MPSEPDSQAPAPSPRYDQAQIWMCYAAFSGDTVKTSIVAKVPLSVVHSLEHDFDWPAKLKRLKTGTGETEAERVANRAINYLQAQRMREVLDRSLDLLRDEEGLLKALVRCKFDENGLLDHVDVSPKAILELSKALEAVHNMCYRALGDKIPAAADVTDSASNMQAAATDLLSVRSVLSALNDLASKPTPAQVTELAVKALDEAKPAEVSAE